MKARKRMWFLPLALLNFFILSTLAHADLYWESEVRTSGAPAGLEGLPPQARPELLDQLKPQTKIVKNYLTSNASRSDISLDPYYRLNPGILRGGIELDSAEQVAVVGQGQGRHAESDRLMDQVSGLGRPVEQAVVRVVMEVDKGFLHG